MDKETQYAFVIIVEHDFWLSEPFTKPQALLDFVYLVKLGSVITENQLSKRWQWSRSKVRKFLFDVRDFELQKQEKRQQKRQQKEQEKRQVILMEIAMRLCQKLKDRLGQCGKQKTAMRYRIL